jgi:thiamine-monophosphate kinase
MPRAGDEFALIESYFAPLAKGHPGSFGLRNDAAALAVSADRDLIATADLLIAGVHFRAQDPPAAIAAKCLAVNLSDLASMGAKPLGYLLSICWPAAPEGDWVAAFTDGLRQTQEAFGMALLGGDTTAGGGSLVIGVTALGEAPKGRALTRGGARKGDHVYVSGTLGDAALGLRVLNGDLKALPKKAADFLIGRYRLPSARVALGRGLLKGRLASACIDISDGLLADARHIAETSEIGISIRRGDLPLSESAGALVNRDASLWRDVLTGGDDYELLFTAPPAKEPALRNLAERLDLRLTAIGTVGEGDSVQLHDESGNVVSVDGTGWRHF